MTRTFKDIPKGAAFFHGTPYIKLSSLMAIPIISGRSGLKKIRFRPTQEVELMKALTATGKQGSQLQVKW